MIEFGKENIECGKLPPCLLSCQEIIDEDAANNTLEIVVELNSGNIYKIVFEQYLMYLVRNESYTSWDNYEERSGNYFILFSKSRLLDILDTMIIHTEDHSFPGIGIHYGVYTCDHIIDIISAHEPEITEWHD